MDETIKSKLNVYPPAVKAELVKLRELIFAIAKTESLGTISESLKWGQLSFSSPKGSPFRIDWSPDTPTDVSLFFHCQSKLISTFREVYPNNFNYVGNRQIVLPLCSASKHKALSHCISVALRYHQVKEIPLLGL
ncbi:MAG: DUF1801 domain-containing protein [Pseudomonadales bacterium]|nr:DUF1801 domain-containing protein [Pseudomonadales bacterium]